MTCKTALITGVTGQDGAILAKLLIEKGYQVHGLRPYLPVCDDERLVGLDEVTLHYNDMTDSGNLSRLVDQIQPHEIYNLAAMSHVYVSFDIPEATANVNAVGVTRLLEAIRNAKGENDIRFYQASSSEMFGRSAPPQNEKTPLEPCSPYGTAKLYAYWMTRNYRDTYGLFATNGILFNHESALRGEEFVTRKITKAVCEIEAGKCDKLFLGNLDSRRDWGHARDYMEGAWQMLQADQPDDYVLATGQDHSVREFVEAAFSYIGKKIIWEGEGVDEVGHDKITGNILVAVDPKFFRPKEIHHLLGDASKAKKELGWVPNITFDQLVQEMIEADRLIVRNTYAV
jgi:GDPmannose 4,6-dehydratase